MNITLAIVDMQSGYVPSEGSQYYMLKRAELISNILELVDYTLGLDGRILLINTVNHGDMIPELQHLDKKHENVVRLTKWYNSLLHFDQVPRYHQIQNSSSIKEALRGERLQIVGVNASWCVLETVKSVKILKKDNSEYKAGILVPFHATMNIPYPESSCDNSQLARINDKNSIRHDYSSIVGHGILSGKSMFAS